MGGSLRSWRFQQLKSRKLFYLFHATHFENLPSILEEGLLSHRELERRGVRYRDVSMADVQDRREGRRVRVSADELLSVHDMVPLFIRAKNPMLYKRRELADSLALILVQGAYVCGDDIKVVVCDGNVASSHTRTAYRFGPNGQFLDELPWDVLNAEYWTDAPDGSRKRSAEFLVWPKVAPSGFWKTWVKNARGREHVETLLKQQRRNPSIECEVNAQQFF